MFSMSLMNWSSILSNDLLTCSIACVYLSSDAVSISQRGVAATKKVGSSGITVIHLVLGGKPTVSIQFPNMRNNMNSRGLCKYFNNRPCNSTRILYDSVRVDGCWFYFRRLPPTATHVYFPCQGYFTKKMGKPEKTKKIAISEDTLICEKVTQIMLTF